MKNVSIIITLLLVLTIGIGIYYVQKNSTSNVIGETDFPYLDSSKATPSSIKRAIDAVNTYAFKQYNQYKTQKGDNIFFSPYSISTCLSMIYEGAKGDTAEEIQQVFEWSNEKAERIPSTAHIINKINDPENICEIHSANAVWAQEEYPFNEEYINVLESGYGGKAINLDFSKSEMARKQINEWVEYRTNNKIQDLFQEGMIDASTVMVLTNAVYFKGDWIHEFDPGRTREAVFKVSDELQVRVDTMYLRDKWFNYSETDEVQVLEMGYLGGDYSMIIILPKELGLEEVERSFNYEVYSGWVEDLEEREAILSVPKFNLETKYVMNEGLSDLGMPLGFTPSADFGGVSSSGGLWLGTVVHQAYVNVGEKGTEAAAATGGSYVMSMPSGVRFVVDHPFIFTIINRETGLILFMGRVIDPS